MSATADPQDSYCARCGHHEGWHTALEVPRGHCEAVNPNGRSCSCRQFKEGKIVSPPTRSRSWDDSH